MYKKILVPTDGSEASDREIKKAEKVLADGGEIIILSVANQLQRTYFQKKKDIKELNEGFLEEAKDNVENMKNKFSDNIKITTKVLTGFPAETIVKTANDEDVDLIVISSSGIDGVAKFFLGSVAEKVVHSAETDVLLIHEGE